MSYFDISFIKELRLMFQNIFTQIWSYLGNKKKVAINERIYTNYNECVKLKYAEHNILTLATSLYEQNTYYYKL